MKLLLVLPVVLIGLTGTSMAYASDPWMLVSDDGSFVILGESVFDRALFQEAFIDGHVVTIEDVTIDRPDVESGMVFGTVSETDNKVIIRYDLDTGKMTAKIWLPDNEQLRIVTIGEKFTI